MSSPTNLFMFILMLTSILWTISANSWFSMWLGLEMNTISFISLLHNNTSKVNSEACMIYFLPQAMASSLFIISSLYLKNNTLYFYYLPLFFITFSMIMKLGMAPMHYWLIKMAKMIPWKNLFILLTMQKLPPFFIISLNFHLSLYLFFFIISSALFGSIGGLSQTNIKTMMAFSSVSHMSWMASTLFINNMMWLFYLLIYSFILLPIISLLNKNAFTLNHITSLNYPFLMSLTLMILLFSLGGMPPMTGFIPKWMIITSISLPFLLFILITSALINLYFYLRITYPIMLIASSKIWHPIKMKMNITLYLLFILSSFSLPFLFPLLYSYSFF